MSKEEDVKARVPRTTRKRLEEIAERKGESLSVVVREALNSYLEKHDVEKRRPVRYTDTAPPRKAGRRKVLRDYKTKGH